MKIMIFEWSFSGHRLTYSKKFNKFLTGSYIYNLDNKHKKKSLLNLLRVDDIVFFESADDFFFQSLAFAMIRALISKKTMLNYYQAHLFISRKTIKGFLKKIYFQIVVNISKRHVHIFYTNHLLSDSFAHFKNSSFLPDIQMSYQKANDLKYKRNISNPLGKIQFLLAGSITARKGLERTLEVFSPFIKKTSTEFELVIAGKIQDATQKELLILDSLKEFSSLKVIDHFLTDAEFSSLFECSNYILIPYDKSFSGPSGILMTAIQFRKTIISTSHGYVGNLVEKYKLGMTFDYDDVESYKAIISKVFEECIDLPEPDYESLEYELGKGKFESEISSVLSRWNKK